jgi:hypothetical protein
LDAWINEPIQASSSSEDEEENEKSETTAVRKDIFLTKSRDEERRSPKPELTEEELKQVRTTQIRCELDVKRRYKR